MPTVIAIATNTRGGHLVCGNPPEPVVHEAEITDDFSSAEVQWKIGATVAKAVKHAWKGGYDPTTIFFKVRFE